MSGNYYLSIFPGNRGVTSRTQYKVDPSFIGAIVSRPPNPIHKTNLIIKNNDLYVEWANDDISEAAITLLVFTQDTSGNRVEFFLSNYNKRFKIPYP
jgi:hypothetical protein